MAIVQGETTSATPRQVEVLQLLARRDHWSVGGVATELGVSSAAATKAIVRLERKGLVSRSVDMMDRRCVIVRITRAGTDIVHHTAKAHGVTK
jgi:DNA-binding MarR family transcriptional regulator